MVVLEKQYMVFEAENSYTHRFSRTVQSGFSVQSRPTTFYAKNEALYDHSDIITIL